MSVCPGLTIRVFPVTEHGSRASSASAGSILATTFVIDQSAEAAGAFFDLVGPYADLGGKPKNPNPYGVFGLNAWRVTESGHELDVNWGGDGWFEEQTMLQLGFSGGSCRGERIVACSLAGCDVTP